MLKPKSGVDKFTSTRPIFRKIASKKQSGTQKKPGCAKSKSMCTSDRETTKNNHLSLLPK